jgi:hypothetical protein
MFRLQLICLVSLAAAGLIRPHHETLLATDLKTVDAGASESIRSAQHDELTLLDGEARQLDSMIIEVMNNLQRAVNTLQSVKNASSNTTSNTTKPESKVVASHKNLTLAKKAAPTTKLVMSKAEVNATLHNEQNLLQDLMKHLNSQIKNFNREDSEAKEMATKMKKKFEEKLEKDEAALNKTGLRDFEHARLVNATRMDKQDLAYWSRDGELRHNMVHANLQMSTNLLSSVKNVLDVYNQAVKKGGVDDKLLKKVKAAALTTSFVQLRKDLQQHVQTYKAQLRSM